MAKQLFKSARADTVGAAEPKAAVAEPVAVADHAVADDNVLDRAALLAVIGDIFDDLPDMIAELDAQRRSSGHDRDHSEHV